VSLISVDGDDEWSFVSDDPRPTTLIRIVQNLAPPKQYIPRTYA
jgi:hypothetical protein